MTVKTIAAWDIDDDLRVRLERHTTKDGATFHIVTGNASTEIGGVAEAQEMYRALGEMLGLDAD